MKRRKQHPRRMLKLRLRAESAAFASAIAELSGLLAGASELEGDLLSPELRKLLVDYLSGLALDGSQLIRLHVDPAAARTGDVLVALEPSDLLLELLAALRAGQRDGH